ncbi:MAG: hypothetical protein ACRC1J_11370, partial [Sandaracinobacteroides sp.]
HSVLKYAPVGVAAALGLYWFFRKRSGTSTMEDRKAPPGSNPFYAGDANHNASTADRMGETDNNGLDDLNEMPNPAYREPGYAM